MEFVVKGAILLFLIWGIALIVISYRSIIKKYNMNRKAVACNQNAQDVIDEMSSETDAYKIAAGFVFLMQCAYVLIHTMINDGNNYNDTIQTKMYCSSLTAETMKDLWSLEGQHE